MKTFLMLITIVLTNQVQAQYEFQCPKLVGSYGPCVTEPASQAVAGDLLVTISENKLNGYPHFLLKTEQKGQETKELSILADGSAHPAMLSFGAALGIEASMVSACHDHVIDYSMSVKNQLGDTYLTLLTSTRISLSGDQLKIVDVYALNNYTITRTCPRKK